VILITERTVELEATIHSLQHQLQEQEDDANNAINQWQEACAVAEEKCASLEEEIGRIRTTQEGAYEIGANKLALRDLQEALAVKEGELLIALQSVENSKSHIQELRGRSKTTHTILFRIFC